MILQFILIQLHYAVFHYETLYFKVPRHFKDCISYNRLPISAICSSLRLWYSAFWNFSWDTSYIQMEINDRCFFIHPRKLQCSCKYFYIHYSVMVHEISLMYSSCTLNTIQHNNCSTQWIFCLENFLYWKYYVRQYFWSEIFSSE